MQSLIDVVVVLVAIYLFVDLEVTLFNKKFVHRGILSGRKE